MSFYKLKAYIHYRWIAKGRHGVHSPFVYDFIEDVLNSSEGTPLMKKLEDKFGKENLIMTDADGPFHGPRIGKKAATIKPNDVVIVTGIHRSRTREAFWNELCNDESTRMSIDLFSVGLLLFREEFKEKQHFVLKR